MKWFIGFIFFVFTFIFVGGTMAVEISKDAWESEELKWRADKTESLKKNWLTVVGLDWLSEGESTIGSGKDNKVKMPPLGPEHLGTLIVAKGQVSFRLESPKGVMVGDKSGDKRGEKKTYAMKFDTSKDPTMVKINGIEFHIIQRPNGLGVRTQDRESATLKNFKGLHWWAPQKSFVIQGRWNEFKEPREVRIPDLQGNSNVEMMKGSVIFEIGKEKLELFPSREGDDLFFVFKDATSGKESYGTGRFLTAAVKKDGTVELNFNRAYNPPCAQINYATCPLAPRENILKVAIPAGEKYSGHH